MPAVIAFILAILCVAVVVWLVIVAVVYPFWYMGGLLEAWFGLDQAVGAWISFGVLVVLIATSPLWWHVGLFRIRQFILRLRARRAGLRQPRGQNQPMPAGGQLSGRPPGGCCNDPPVTSLADQKNPQDDAQ